MHERRFADVERLRSPKRIAELELENLIPLVLEGAAFQTALDIGAGTGIFAEAFARRGLRVEGVDVNPAMLAAARAFAPQANFREGAAENLPYADQAFDLVFMGMVLHETDDWRQALREAARVARLRLALLEWPYEAGEFGPPLAERLSPEALTRAGEQAGLPAPRMFRLTHFALYRWDKSRQP